MDETRSPDYEFGGFRLDTQLLSDPIIEISSAAPDGKAVVVDRPAAENVGDAWVIPVDSTSAARVLNKGYSPARWSLDGKTLYVGLNIQDHIALTGSTVALPTGTDDLPQSPMLAATAGGKLIPQQSAGLWVGSDPEVYVYLKSERRQNIYRIPLH